MFVIAFSDAVYSFSLVVIKEKRFTATNWAGGKRIRVYFLPCIIMRIEKISLSMLLRYFNRLKAPRNIKHLVHKVFFSNLPTKSFLALPSFFFLRYFAGFFTESTYI